MRLSQTALCIAATSALATLTFSAYASPEGAQRILTRLQKLSAPLGTQITIENNIGVIGPRPATTASGGR